MTVTAYLHALIEKDWPGACATWLTSEREKLAVLGGTCERTMSSMFAEQPLEMFSTVRAAAARRRGDVIAVDVVQPGQTAPALVMLLQREGAQWLLVDLPDADQF